jgi:predicted dehydrogenase
MVNEVALSSETYTGREPGVLFVGAGMVSELHQRAIAVGRHLRLVGLLEPRAELAHRRATEWGVRMYTHLDQALKDPAIEAVLVLTPAETHAELALRSLRAGRHVMVEKPVGTPDAIALLEREASRRQLVCMPAHNYAYQPEFRALRRAIRDAELGQIRAAWFTYVLRHPESVAQAYGNVLEEVMIHHTYLALCLFGMPSILHAGSLEPAWEKHTAEDQAWMTWHYPPGMSVHHFATFAVADHTSSPWLFAVKALGDAGSASYNWQDTVFKRPLGTLPFAVQAYEDSYIHEHEAFAAAIAGDTRAIISTLGDASDTARLLMSARLASDQGSSVQPMPQLARA